MSVPAIHTEGPANRCRSVNALADLTSTGGMS